MICHCVRRGWELGTEDNNLNFESAMMCTNNVVVMNLRIMHVVVVISLTHTNLFDRLLLCHESLTQWSAEVPRKVYI